MEQTLPAGDAVWESCHNLILGQELRQCTSSPLHLQVCLEIVPALEIWFSFCLWFCLLACLLCAFPLFPAEGIIGGSGTRAGWHQRCWGVEISIISKPGAKGCRTAVHGWDGTAGTSEQQGLAPRTITKGFRGKQPLGAGKSGKSWFTAGVGHMCDFKLQHTAAKHSAENNWPGCPWQSDPPSFHRKRMSCSWWRNWLRFHLLRSYPTTICSFASLSFGEGHSVQTGAVFGRAVQ